MLIQLLIEKDHINAIVVLVNKNKQSLINTKKT